MTPAAREALEDCRVALGDLSDEVQGRQWRVRWFACVVLLRAVGHVLDKVDGPRDPKLRRAIDQWWATLNASKPNPAIFWSFIDEDRRNRPPQKDWGAPISI